ncbi:hypothetical protein L7F22_007745 [Adiantum nelumboides]|nr:hypothetical protein [Adiantum nelumboides]
MKQFLSSDAKDKVLTEWQSLKLTPYESIQKYVDKFWDLHLKATVYRKIDFEEQKQQFCAGLPEDMNEYVNSQRPKTISAVIHHTMVAAKIKFQQGAKRNFKPMEIKEKHEHKGKNQPPNSSKGNSSNNKAKEKGVYKGKNRLTSEELERYRKDNRCFKCGEQGHAYRACPQRNARNEQPRASIIEAPKEDVHCKGSPLSYTWGKVREHDAFILFDPGSTHNFISHELAAKLGIQEFEMGDAMKVDGAFIGQDASVTPLIGKLRLHIQGYVDKEDFFISPLKHEDVILGAPWFDCLAASIKFPKRRNSFKFREKNMYIDAQESGNTIPLVHTHAFDKSIKSSISVYMIFVKDSLSDVNKTQVNESGLKEDLELSKFLNQFQDVFIDDILGEFSPKRGDDDHAIELIPGSSPPNKPPYRVSQAQQEEIMRQVNELVEKGMVRPSSSPFCSPVLLVHKKDGTYRMCVNYRALNKITIKNRFPVPRIEDLLDKLQGSTYFSRIDLKSGYHQIRIVNEDILKTGFRTTFGLYEYLVMPFGLTNALATFNRMMERIFRPHRNFTGVFFDDVIIYSKVTRVHVPHTTSHDIFMMQKLGLADPKSILDKFDDEDRAKAERVLRGTAMLRSKWLRLPMALLLQLLWKEEFDRMYQEKIQNLPAQDTREYMDHEEDYKASYAMALKATESVFVRKGLEIAVIANPDNGSDFFRLCISFPSWGERGCKMTTFRVSEIARAHITSQEKCRLLGLLASVNAALKEAGIPSNEKPFSQWLRMHVYWWQLERSLYETSKKGTSLGNEEEMHDEPPQQSAKDGAVHQELSKERNRSDTQITSKSNATTRRERAKRSPSPTKKKWSSSTPSHANSKRVEDNSRRRNWRK